jgi:hypothetical protein
MVRMVLMKSATTVLTAAFEFAMAAHQLPWFGSCASW